MAINADTLLDRLYLKSQIAKWRIAAIVLGVLALLAFMERNSSHSPIQGDFIARITLDGIVGDDQKIYELIDDVAGNNKAKAVIVWLDTPGGSAVGGEEIFLRLRELSKRKPVVAVMRSVSASAGYMIALGTDYILAREGTITGSIGVLIETAEISELADKIGIKPIVIKSAPLKGSPSFFEKSTPEAERVLHDVINDFYQRFIDMVADRRQLPRDKVIALADGRVYSGKRALDNKLIDAIGGEEEARQWLVQKKHIKSGLDIKDVEVKKADNFLDSLSQSIAGKFFNRSSVTLDGVNAIWHPNLH